MITKIVKRKFKYLKHFENFQESDINDKILKGELISAKQIREIGDTEVKKDEEGNYINLKPVSCDEESVTVEIDNKEYEVDLKDVIA
jgi:hypothetical protein